MLTREQLKAKALEKHEVRKEHDRIKVIDGHRSTLEQELTRALFRGESEQFERLNAQLQPRHARLSLISPSPATNPPQT
jgi:restriction endonuclease Mrr